jgi:hypothetical protein
MIAEIEKDFMWIIRTHAVVKLIRKLSKESSNVERKGETSKIRENSEVGTPDS